MPTLCTVESPVRERRMDIVYVLLIVVFGLSLIGLVAACRKLEERGNGR
jgi:hypothetical protein